MATRDTYTKVHEDWKNQPDETTPVYAEDLEHIEQGIKDAADKRALKEIYDDKAINLGRKQNSGIGYFSTAEGVDVIADGSYSHAEGRSTTASNTASHAEGGYTTASGYHSHAEGYSTSAEGDYAHSEGINTVAKKTGHAEGHETKAIGNVCHAEGIGTIAAGEFQHVSGKYNVQDPGRYAVIVGGGTSDSDRKNIHALGWNGDAYFAGDVSNGAGVSLNSLKSTIDNLPTGGGVTAKVFDTKADLDAWLAVEGNADTLVVGQNIYIKATDTPDYWWDGTGLQILETDKVEIESMTYDETMAILNATAEEVA